MTERDFEGIWIPVLIWEDPKLTPFAKCLLAEVNSLDCGEGCWKTDANLAKRMQCSESHVMNTISKLKKLGYLKTIQRGRHRRYLRTSYSRHLTPTAKSRSHLLRKVGDSVSTIQKRIQRDCEPLASPDRVKESPAGKMAKRFIEFAIEKRLLTGRAAPNPFTWRKAIDKLMIQLDCKPTRIAKVMRWHFVHFRDEYCPVAYAATTFCDKFLAIERVAGMTPKVEETPPKDNRVITKGKIDDSWDD